MTPEQLGQLLDELGKRLGPAGSHVFGLAVRQVIIEGAISLVVGTALLVLGVQMWRKGMRWVAEKADPYDEDMQRAGVAFAVLLIAGAGAAFLYGALTTLPNPEYAAIRDILGRIKP